MKTAITITTLLFLSGVGFSQDSLNVSVTGSLYNNWGDVEDMKIGDDFAYVAVGLSGLRILDIRDPASPIELGHCLEPNDASAVDVQGHYAYVCESWHVDNDPTGGLWIIDISIPSNPFSVGFLELDGPMQAVSVEGNYACVAGWAIGMHVVDITNPLNPVLAGSYNNLGTTRDLEFRDGIAYAGTTSGLSLIDVGTDPHNPTRLSFLDMPDSVYGLAIFGNYVYVANSGVGDFRIVDVSDPLIPVEVGAANIQERANKVVVTASHAYVACGHGGLEVFDISDPSQPTLVGSYQNDHYMWSIALGRDVVFMGDRNAGMFSISVEDPMQPTFINRHSAMGQSYGVVVEGDYAYLSNLDDVVRIVDITDASNPNEVGACSTDYQWSAIAKSGEYVYVGDDDGVMIIDVSDPDFPTLVSSFPTGFVYALLVEDGYAYVGASPEVKIFNVSDPMAPFEIANLDHFARGFVLQDDLLYGVSTNPGFMIFDVSQPEAPVCLATWYTHDNQVDVAIEGNFAYMLCNPVIGGFPNNVKVIDVSDPEIPIMISDLELPDRPYAIDIQDQFIYVADYHGGLRVIDVHDPYQLVETGYYNTLGATRDVVINGDLAYVTDASSFKILDCSEATTGYEPLVDVEIDVADPLTVPQGGSFDYSVTATSYLPQPYNIDFWAWVVFADGFHYGPIWRLTNIQMTPGMVIQAESVSQAVPAIVPPGLYSYHIAAGAFPSIRVDEESFEFTVTPAENGSTGDANWSASGYTAAFGIESHGIPDVSGFELSEAKPNPFNSSTSVTVVLPEASILRVMVFNTLGQQVAELVNGRVNAGTQTLTFDASGLASGLYFVQAYVPGHLDKIQKVMLVR
jgi:hypothetical protein